jgi:ankyrin repeat protein
MSSTPSSKTLPATPRLAHLKNQAKKLLKAYRAGDPAAIYRLSQHRPAAIATPATPKLSDVKLSDAQLVIAREYGFASWPRLKKHVEGLTQPTADLLGEFRTAVNRSDTQRVRRLLQQHAELRAAINDPLFDFDSPAIVHSKNSREMIEVLLQFGADINARSHWWAGGFGVLDGVWPEAGQYLIERGATIDIHAAATLNRLDILQQLLAANPEAVNAKGGDGMRPLHFARSPEIIVYLLQHGAEIDARDIDHNSTPAQYAIEDPVKLRHLLGRGAQPDIFMACVLGDIELAKRVIQHDPGALQSRIGQGQFVAPGGHIYVYNLGYTARPLYLAAQHGHTALSEYLLPLATPAQRFLFACLAADEAMAQAELKKNPGLLQSLEPEDRSIICEAAWDNKAAAVSLMLRCGFDVNTRGVHNSTPIDRAATWGYREVVKVCLEHNADLTVVNEFGGRPLTACLYGSEHLRRPQSEHAACIELLLQAGDTPPDHLWGSPECIEVLQRHGVPESVETPH